MKPALLCVLLCACALPDDDLGSASEAITNANPTSSAPYAVWLNGSCTAVVISRHWLLTAAHCFAGTPGTRTVCIKRGAHIDPGQVIYYGIGEAWIHPSYHYKTSGDEEWDLALVRLEDAGLSVVEPAHFYAGPETPWTTRQPSVDIIGYGLGTNVGGRQDCADHQDPDGGLDHENKRRGTFAWSGSGEGGWLGVDAYANDRTICPGDSGGPWSIVRNGGDYVVAVSSKSPYEQPGHSVIGTRVDPKWSWVTGFMTLRGPAPTCTNIQDHRVTPEIDSHLCSEAPPSPLDPPPPAWADCGVPVGSAP